MAQTTPATAPAATTTLATLLNTPPSYAGDRHALLRLPAMSSGARADNALAAGLDHPLPAEVVAGTGTAVLVAGWCFAPGSRVKSLKLTVNGAEQRVLAHGMSRRDVAAANPEHPESHASGFWGFVLIDAPGTASIGVKATLTGGRTERADLAEIHVIEAPDPVELAPPASGPLIAVAMATYNPDPELLAIQLDSLRAQSHANWVCVISDDCSDDKYYAQLKSAIANDPRFHLSRSSKRLGFYNNFERALTMVPSAADFVALADQDDRWHPDKLEVLLREIGDAALVFSDARLTTASGEVLASTYWSVRRPNHDSPAALLAANSVTGAASLMHRSLLDHALPFPPRQFAHFHDHWLALAASATGQVKFVDRPLYDYVQHGDAVIGHGAANEMPSLASRVEKLRTDPRERIGRWRNHYFADTLRLRQYTEILALRTVGAPSTNLRAMQRLTGAESSLRGLVLTAVAGAREVAGRSLTLGAEVGLFFAYTWRRLASAAKRRGPDSRLHIDARPPANLLPTPGRRDPGDPAVKTLADKIAPLPLAVSESAPVRINVLVPTIDLDHLFGGYIGKFNLALRLARRGARVRIVTVDPVPALPTDWCRRVEGYAGLDGLFDEVEVEFGRESAGIEVSREDRFVASTWWTALIADAACKQLGTSPFLYLIQEYEPFTFPMGSYAALAEGSYRTDHRALFSTELLRDYFRQQRLGVFATSTDEGDSRSVSFQNAITAVEPESAKVLAERRPRKLLFYARPEPHAARNLYELGVLALIEAARRGTFAGDWELDGVGSIDRARQVDLGSGKRLQLRPRAAQQSYAETLRGYDVGLSLMHTPHPSLVPLEMCSAGLVTVTSTFAGKTPARLAELSSNLIAAEPTVDALASALQTAVERAEQVEERVAGAAVAWSRTWDESLSESVLDAVQEAWRA